MKLSYHLQAQQKEHNRVRAELKKLEAAEKFYEENIKGTISQSRAALIGIVFAFTIAISVLTFSPNAVGLPIGDSRYYVLVINIFILYMLYVTGKR